MLFEIQESETNRLSGYPHFANRLLSSIKITLQCIYSGDLDGKGYDLRYFLDESTAFAGTDISSISDSLNKLVTVYKHYHFKDQTERIIAEIDLKLWTDKLLLEKAYNSLDNTQKAEKFLDKILHSKDDFSRALYTLNTLINSSEFLQVAEARLEYAAYTSRHIVNRSVLSERKNPSEKLLITTQRIVDFAKLDFGNTPAGELMVYFLNVCMPLVQRKQSILMRDISELQTTNFKQTGKVTFAPDSEHVFNNLIIILSTLLPINNNQQSIESELNRFMHDVKQNTNASIVYKLNSELKRYGVYLDQTLVRKLQFQVTQQQYFTVDQTTQAAGNSQSTALIEQLSLQNSNNANSVADDDSASPIDDTLETQYTQGGRSKLAELAKVSLENMKILQQILGSLMQKIDDLSCDGDIETLQTELENQIIIKGKEVSASEIWTSKHPDALDTTSAITGLKNIFIIIEPQIKEHLTHKSSIWNGLQIISKSKITLENCFATMNQQYDQITKWKTLQTDWNFLTSCSSVWPIAGGNTVRFNEYISQFLLRLSQSNNVFQFNTWSVLKHIVLKSPQLYNSLRMVDESDTLLDDLNIILMKKESIGQNILTAWQVEVQKLGLSVFTPSSGDRKSRPRVFFSPVTNAKIICEKILPNLLEQRKLSKEEMYAVIEKQRRYSVYCQENPQLKSKDVLEVIAQEIINQMEARGWCKTGEDIWIKKTLADLKRDAVKADTRAYKQNQKGYTEINSQIVLELRTVAQKIKQNVSQIVTQMPRTYVLTFGYDQTPDKLTETKFLNLIIQNCKENLSTVIITEGRAELTLEKLEKMVGELRENFDYFCAKVNQLVIMNMGSVNQMIDRSLLQDHMQKNLFRSNHLVSDVKADAVGDVIEDVFGLFFSQNKHITDEGIIIYEQAGKNKMANINTHITNHSKWKVLRRAKEINLIRLPINFPETVLRAQKIFNCIENSMDLLDQLAPAPNTVISRSNPIFNPFIDNLAAHLHGKGVNTDQVNLEKKKVAVKSAFQYDNVWQSLKNYLRSKVTYNFELFSQELTIAILNEVYKDSKYEKLVWDSTNPQIAGLKQMMERFDRAVYIFSLDELTQDLEVSIPNKTKFMDSVLVAVTSDESPENIVEQKTLREDLNLVLGTLSSRERDVLKLRYGLEDGIQRTNVEIGRIFNITSERIRQIESKALRKLRHPNRNRFLQEYLE